MQRKYFLDILFWNDLCFSFRIWNMYSILFCPVAFLLSGQLWVWFRFLYKWTDFRNVHISVSLLYVQPKRAWLWRIRARLTSDWNYLGFPFLAVSPSPFFLRILEGCLISLNASFISASLSASFKIQLSLRLAIWWSQLILVAFLSLT